MSIIQGNAHTSAGGGGYQIERSLRFNSADSAYLNRTLGTSNRRTFTFSTWIKRSLLASTQCIFGTINFAGGGSTNQQFYLGINSSDQLDLFHYNNGTNNNLLTSAVYRDPSAWYHVVIGIDTTQATSSNRMKLYVNGSQITTFASSSYPAQNTDTFINANLATGIGCQVGTGIGNSYFFGGYQTEINFIDGQALTPSDFGETDSATGVWKPKAFSGTYGTNGFYLKFADNSGTTSTTLGKDSSGNGNNWTPNNFSVTAGSGNDSLVDSPTSYGTDTGVGGEVRGNYATLNPLAKGAGVVLSDGNLGYTSNATYRVVLGSIAVASGKYYWEVTAPSNAYAFGVADVSYKIFDSSILATGNLFSYSSFSGDKYIGLSFTQSSYDTSGGISTSTVLGFAVDFDTGTATIYRNGVSKGVIHTWTPGATYAPFAGYDTTPSGVAYFNFGQRAFSYTAPSGFKALCTQNLPTPTIGATSTTQANDYFNAVLWTGVNSSAGRSVTGVGFQPDLVWAKRRSSSGDNLLYDAIRGAGSNKELTSNLTSAEGGNNPDTYDYLSSFDSDGFSSTWSGSNNAYYFNELNETYVAWNWKANGAGSSNTAGQITSTVSANTTSGFSIVTFTTDGTTKTVGHGLGAKPSLVIVKRRNGADAWLVITDITGSMQYGVLNTTAAFASIGYSAPTSTVFSYNDNNGNTQVAYCFAPVAGYSAFGSYTGNGSADGPMIFTGFRPRYLMVKEASGTSAASGNWVIHDAVRDTYNVCGLRLVADNSYAEGTVNAFDFLSNGFKLRTTDAGRNESGGTYIYMAFAESPFKYSLAR